MKLFEDLPNTDTPINAENLNQIQDNLVVVSATEPTGDNREKVWIQKGKNLFNLKNVPNTDVITNNNDGTLTFANNSSNVGYTDTGKRLSSVFNGIIGNTYTMNFENTFSQSDRNYRIYLDGANVYLNKNTPFVLTQAMLDSTIILYGGYNETSTMSNIQIEQGTTATAYEAYIEPKIYVLNDNDVYEEFISKEDTLERYSTEEQIIGTWIDGKTLYRKVINVGTTTTVTTKIDYIPDIKAIIKQYVSYSWGGMLFSIGSNAIYSGSGNIAMEFDRAPESTNIVAVIEYTKTTD